MSQFNHLSVHAQKVKQTKDLATWSRPRKHGHGHDNKDVLEKLVHKTVEYNINLLINIFRHSYNSKPKGLIKL